jgi:hypothetical protein
VCVTWIWEGGDECAALQGTAARNGSPLSFRSPCRLPMARTSGSMYTVNYAVFPPLYLSPFLLPPLSPYLGATSKTASLSERAMRGPPRATARAAASLWGSWPLASKRVKGLMGLKSSATAPGSSGSRRWSKERRRRQGGGGWRRRRVSLAALAL